MIAQLKIEGLGPIVSETFKFDPEGISTISGKSEIGKTTVIDAVCFVLWGVDRAGKLLPTEGINDDCDAALVEMVLSSGSTLTRRLEKGPDGTRGETSRVKVDKYGVSHEAKTRTEWTALLRDLGANAPALRAVIVPMAWRKLAESKGNGRELRNLLASILPQVKLADVVRELMGDQWREGDPVHEGDAEQMRKEAKRLADKLTARVDGLNELEAAAQASAAAATGPSDGDFAIAKGIENLAKKWAAHKAASDHHVEVEEKNAKVADNLEGWRKRLAELGDAPKGGGGITEFRDTLNEILAVEVGIEADVASLREHARASREASIKATSAYDARLSERQRLEKHPTVCPECGQDRPESDNVEKARKFEKAADDLVTETSAKSRRDATTLDQAKKRLGLATGDTQRARERLAEAKGADPLLIWQGKIDALGRQPAAADDPQDPPAFPGDEMPDEADIASALKTIREWEQSTGRRKERATNAATAKKMLAEAISACTKALNEAERLELLVASVRQAPSIHVKRSKGTMGDLGPVFLELRDDGGVDVQIDGRPFYMASAGRLVVADVWLRAGFRRAMGMPYLTMVVDMVQSVAGQPIPEFPPAIWLRTIDEPLMVRERAGP